MSPPFLLVNHDISLLSAFKTPAIARYFFEVSSMDDLPQLKVAYDFANAISLPIVYLGSGTNCLFAFDTFDGLIIKNSLKGFELSEINGQKTLRVCSAELVSPMSTSLFRSQNISLFLPWVWLPGTFGGAVCGNAGCFGLETADILIHVEVLNLVSGEVEKLPASTLDFRYRWSALKGNTQYFIVAAIFGLDRIVSNNEYMQKTPEEMQQIRRTKQPPGLSCGSYFRNPVGDSAGRIIDKELTMNGTKFGSVQISERHGNFFLAPLWADWRDVLALAELVKHAARAKLGIELSEEVRIIRNETSNYHQ